MAADDQPVVAAILVAGGSGTRLGAEVPKAFVRIAGRTLLEHAASRFGPDAAVRELVVVVPADRLAEAAELVSTAVVVAGGATRQESVRLGLAAVSPDARFVLVHDVARAFVPPAVPARVLAALAAGADAVVPVVPVTDTVRSIGAGSLGGTLDRDGLGVVQTPQGFRRDLLVSAHEHTTDDAATDDAVLVEAIGGRVTAVAGDELAFKITRPLDLRLAELVAESVVDPVRDRS